MDIEFLTGGPAEKIYNMLQDVRHLEERVNKDNTANCNDLVLFSSEGPKPNSNPEYKPSTDLEVGHVAVVVVEQSDSSGGRGWDLVEVRDMPLATTESTFRGVYLMPKYKGHLALKYTNTEFPAWPDDWIHQKLVPITVATRRSKAVEWSDENLSLDSVLFSFKPTSSMMIPQRFLTSVQLACNSIANNIKPPALESDGEGA
jgi:hypothetical protein